LSKRILILGGHGFIGSHTSNLLVNSGHTVGVVDCYHQYYSFPDDEYNVVLPQRIAHSQAQSVYNGRIEDVEFMRSVFEDFKPDRVIHVATYPNAYMVKRNVVDATGNMITATATTLDLCVEHSVDRIVFASSSMVYGDFDAIGSGPPDETAPCNPLTLYGSYKLQGEKMCHIWHKEKGLNHTILRPSALYGSKDMITRVISQLVRARLTTGTMKVQGPDNRLDFSNVIDVASAFYHAVLDDACENQTFNCTRGQGRKIIEAAEMIQGRIGGNIETLPHDEFYPNRDTLNSNKLRELTHWNPEITIDTGIPEYLDWFLAQPFAKAMPLYSEI
jgi:nucleoside-diphosphate-sugar epimerase